MNNRMERFLATMAIIPGSPSDNQTAQFHNRKELRSRRYIRRDTGLRGWNQRSGVIWIDKFHYQKIISTQNDDFSPTFPSTNTCLPSSFSTIALYIETVS